MRAGSSFTNFVTEGNVRQNPQTFNPDLYNKEGVIEGYPGPNTGVAAAAGNPGPHVKVCSNKNMCGGRKTRKGRQMKKIKKSKALNKRIALKKHKTMKKRATKRDMVKSRIKLTKLRRRSRKYLRDVRDLFSMRGGEPASVPTGSSSNGSLQYMTNVPFALSYSSGGKLAPADNAIANPVPIHPTNNCSK